MIRSTRTVVGALVGVCVLALSACAESDVAESAVPTSVESTVESTAESTDASSTTELSGDFGSRFIGEPVAFWFWAPY